MHYFYKLCLLLGALVPATSNVMAQRGFTVTGGMQLGALKNEMLGGKTKASFTFNVGYVFLTDQWEFNGWLGKSSVTQNGINQFYQYDDGGQISYVSAEELKSLKISQYYVGASAGYYLIKRWLCAEAGINYVVSTTQPAQLDAYLYNGNPAKVVEMSKVKYQKGVIAPLLGISFIVNDFKLGAYYQRAISSELLGFDKASHSIFSLMVSARLLPSNKFIRF